MKIFKNFSHKIYDFIQNIYFFRLRTLVLSSQFSINIYEIGDFFNEQDHAKLSWIRQTFINPCFYQDDKTFVYPNCFRKIIESKANIWS